MVGFSGKKLTETLPLFPEHTALVPAVVGFFALKTGLIVIFQIIEYNFLNITNMLNYLIFRAAYKNP